MDATVSDSLVGRMLDGRYRVDAKIARGGMATVYRALDTRLDRTVAIKVMHALFADDEAFVTRFIREAKSAARLSHPNVVAVFDQGEDAGQVFLAMEYIEGRNLRDLLRERGRLSPQEALSVLGPVLAALSAAHDAGLVHRDVKPENVLLADDGRIKVADFGLARAAASRNVTSATTLIGTVAYLAPEQVTRGVADARSDVYAAGIMLFEMLTGQPPYEGETPISVAYRHANEDVPGPSSRVPGLPPSLDALVTRATARDPDLRPVDAGAFLSEAQRVRRSLPVLEADSEVGTGPIRRMHETLVVDLPEAGSAVVGGAAPPAVPVVAGAEGDGLDDGDARRRRRRRRGLIALLVVLLLAAGAAGTGWYYGVARYTTVPSLVNMTQSQAEAKAKAAHLHLVVSGKAWSTTVPAGDVIGQVEPPNHRVLRGHDIAVTLSRGRHVTSVPTFDTSGGTPYSQYKQSLIDAGLTPPSQPEQQYDDNVPAGNVLSVDPKPGTQQDWNKSVVVTVSAGPAPITITDYTNKPADQAQAALSAAGFKVNVAHSYSDTIAAGSVVSQSPASGTGHKGDTINLTVSDGPQLFQVPNVTSGNSPSTWVSISEATATLEHAGFKVKVGKKGIFGVVTHQDPAAGSMKPKGTVVTIDAS